MPAGMDQMQSMMLRLLLEKEMKTKKKKGSGSSSSSSMSSIGDKTANVYAKLQKLRRQRKKQPWKLNKKFRAHVMRHLNVLPGEAWRYRTYWAAMPFRNFRSVGKLAFLLSEIIQEAEAPGEASHRLAVVQATAVQGLKACHQFALDGGSWKAAWPLTLIPDPYAKEEFGGSPEELGAIASWLKTTAELKEKVKGQSVYQKEDAAQGHVEEQEEAGGEEAAPKRKPRNRKK